jgi:hypothetical protein
MISANSKKARVAVSTLAVMMSSSTSSISALILHPVLQSTTVHSAFPAETTSPVIGTHDGSFHCDEALAIVMLKILPEYHLSPIVRTRKPEILQQCHLVVDVGAEYIPEKHRYDHHQREFTGTLDGWKTRLSSAGLVYKHFGREIISEVLRRCEATDVTENFIDICYKKVYQDFMEHIDAIDNGVEVADAPMKYRVSTTLSSRVGHLVPQWNEPNTPEAFNEGFLRAMALTGEVCTADNDFQKLLCKSTFTLFFPFQEFIGVIERMAKYWWPARSIVQRALDDRLSRHGTSILRTSYI